MQISSTDNSRFSEIDIIRGIAILSLLLTHTMAYFVFVDHFNILTLSALYLDVLTSFVVPAFIIISGMVLYKNYPEIQNNWNFYKKRLLSVVPQYIAFSTFYILIAILIGGTALSMLYIGYYYLTGSAYYHLWFFILLIEFYILYPLFIKIYRRADSGTGIRNLLLILLIIQIVWNILILYFCDHSNIVAIKHLIFRRTFPSYIFYFFLGMYFGASHEKILTWVRKINPFPLITTVITLTALISYNWIVNLSNPSTFDSLPYMTFWVDKLLEPFLFVTWFILILKTADILVQRNKGFLFKELGKESFGIFLIHPMYMVLGVELFGVLDLTPDSPMFYPIIFSFTLAFSYLTIKAIRMLPGSQWIIGRVK